MFFGLPQNGRYPLARVHTDRSHDKRAAEIVALSALTAYTQNFAIGYVDLEYVLGEPL